MREAAIIENGELVNVIVLPDGFDGDVMLSDSCVEITDLIPKPGLGNGWTFTNGAFIAPLIPEPTYAQVEQNRHAAYITDADPLFFKWQRGSGTEGEWLAAVEAVKDAHPYPEPV
jgi:hypothetical protein